MSTTQSQIFEFEREVESIDEKIADLNSPYKSEEILRYLYWEEGLSISEVSGRIGCGTETVRLWMEKLGVERRDRIEALQKANRVERAGYRVGSRGYEQWRVKENGSQTIVRVHRLVAVAAGADPHDIWNDDTDTICHHSVGHKLANIPRLIETMSRTEHSTLHEKGEWSYEYDERGFPTLQMPDEEESDEPEETE